MPTRPEPRLRPIDHVVELSDAPDQTGAPALVLRDRVLDYATLRHRVAILAGWLQRECPHPGARIASWASKGELTCILPLAAARAGLVHVPINPLLKRAQVAHIIGDSGARMLIGSAPRLASLEDGDLPPDCRQIADSLALQHSDEAAVALAPSEADPGELAAILYTSGSTGQPKGVMLSHANLWLGAVSVAQYLRLAPDDVTLAVLPLSFDYGQNQLLSTWYACGSVVPLDFLVPRDVVKACARHGVTTLAAVPPLWVQLVETGWSDEALKSLRRLTNSGGALSERLVSDLATTFEDVDLYPMYGLTEAFRSTYLDPALVEKHPTSMGKVVPFAEILVVGDDGEIARANEEGELVHCGPLVAQGYWRDPVRTARRFRPAPSQSRYGGTAVWSGDRVRRDEAGLLHFVGRRDAMIKSAGNRISPQEVEDAAIASGVVAEAAAIGQPDERLGQIVHLVVRGDRDEEKERDLVRYLKSELPNFMHPRQITWRSAMPLSANGKIDRTALERELGERGAS